MTTSTTPKSNSSRHFLIWLALIIAGFFAFLSFGEGGPTQFRLIVVLDQLLRAGWIPAVYLLSAYGLGSLIWNPFSHKDLVSEPAESHSQVWNAPIQLALGLVITLIVSQVLGMMGWLSTLVGWIALLPGLVGCIVLVIKHGSRFQLNQTESVFQSITFSGWACSFLFVLLSSMYIAQSCNPPGVSWNSEAGEYDTLSYHVQLPRIWIENNQIASLESNVYSYLPSAFESAYVHFAYLANSTKPLGDPMPGLSGMLAGQGAVVISTRIFSAILSILTALGMMILVRRLFITIYTLILNSGSINKLNGSVSQASQLSGWQVHLSWIAGILILATPWVMAIGTISYNEIGVLYLGTASWIVVVAHKSDPFFSPSIRAALLAILVGGACLCKPTAIFMLAPSIACVFLMTTPPRSWVRSVPIGICIGLCVLMPWFVRNWIAAGNPVFPQGVSIFGLSHWSQEQHDLYTLAHRFDGTLIDRVLMLFLPDTNAFAHVARFRGLTNLAWGITPSLACIGLLALLINFRTRKIGALCLIATLAPLIAWSLFTHLQSRFLIPMVPLFIGIFILAASSWSLKIARQMVYSSTLIAIFWTTSMALNQRNGHPFSLLVASTHWYSGQTEMNAPAWSSVINTHTHADEVLYLLGDSTSFYVRSPVITNSVYDHWLIEDVIQDHPNNPELWNQSLRDRGVDVIVISWIELDRLDRSGWLPRPIRINQLKEWRKHLPEPIYTWESPNADSIYRSMYRISQPESD